MDTDVERQFLDRFRGMCARCLIHDAVHIHHIAGRVEVDPDDPEWWLPLCVECHDTIRLFSRDEQLLMQYQALEFFAPSVPSSRTHQDE